MSGIGAEMIAGTGSMILSVRDLRVRAGERVILDGVSLDVRAKIRQMQMDEGLLNRGVNEGFSGGEKKRNEILQMSLLEPTIALLDETDSGLDIDALKVVADGVNALRSPACASLCWHSLNAALSAAGAQVSTE